MLHWRMGSQGLGAQFGYGPHRLDAEDPRARLGRRGERKQHQPQAG
ncbi:MAG: hypothetical protein ABSC93_14925 [Bryobacteraceae bacterium]